MSASVRSISPERLSQNQEEARGHDLASITAGHSLLSRPSITAGPQRSEAAARHIVRSEPGQEARGARARRARGAAADAGCPRAARPVAARCWRAAAGGGGGRGGLEVEGGGEDDVAAHHLGGRRELLPKLRVAHHLRPQTKKDIRTRETISDSYAARGSAVPITCAPARGGPAA